MEGASWYPRRVPLLLLCVILELFSAANGIKLADEPKSLELSEPNQTNPVDPFAKIREGLKSLGISDVSETDMGKIAGFLAQANKSDKERRAEAESMNLPKIMVRGTPVQIYPAHLAEPERQEELSRSMEEFLFGGAFDSFEQKLAKASTMIDQLTKSVAEFPSKCTWTSYCVQSAKLMKRLVGVFRVAVANATKHQEPTSLKTMDHMMKLAGQTWPFFVPRGHFEKLWQVMHKEIPKTNSAVNVTEPELVLKSFSTVDQMYKPAFVDVLANRGPDMVTINKWFRQGPQLLKLADTDQSGGISKEEFATYWHAWAGIGLLRYAEQMKPLEDGTDFKCRLLRGCTTSLQTMKNTLQLLDFAIENATEGDEKTGKFGANYLEFAARSMPLFSNILGSMKLTAPYIWWRLTDEEPNREATKEDFTDYSRHELNKYIDMGFGGPLVDFMFAVADHDRSGGIGHEEFLDFMTAAANTDAINPVSFRKEAVLCWLGAIEGGYDGACKNGFKSTKDQRALWHKEKMRGADNHQAAFALMGDRSRDSKVSQS